MWKQYDNKAIWNYRSELVYLNILNISSEKPYYTKMRINLRMIFNYCTHFFGNLQSRLIMNICKPGSRPQ